jgi:hypothetical protein
MERILGNESRDTKPRLRCGCQVLRWKTRTNSKFPGRIVATPRVNVRAPDFSGQYKRRKDENARTSECDEEKMARRTATGHDPQLSTNDVCRQNKCGPGQPPGPHCLARYPEAHFHARGMGEFIFHPHSEEREQRCTRQIAIREANFANQSAAFRWPTASPAVCGGLCEEAATPGQPVHASKRASGGTLPAIHPRELPGTADSAAMLWQGSQNISLE